jgi:Yip1 domain
MDRRTFPWLSIWIEPRATIREIIATDPRRWVAAIAATTGAFGFLTVGLLARANMSISFTNRVVLIGTILAAPAAVGLVYIEAVLCAVSGWALEGNGTIAHTRAALAWSLTPLIWLCLVAIPILGLLRISTVAFVAGQIELVHTPAGQFLATLAWLVFASSFVIGAKGVAEIHGFSVWKGAAARLMTLAAMMVAALEGLCGLAVAYQLARAIVRMVAR